MYPLQYMPRSAMVAWIVRDSFHQGEAEDSLWGLEANANDPDEVVKFRDQISTLSEDELRALYVEKILARSELVRQEQEAQQATLYFNVPSAFADYQFWARCATWTTEQAVSLSLGRDPDLVNGLSLRANECSNSMFGREHRARMRLFGLMERVGQWPGEATPGEALAMLDRLRLDHAPELRECVEALGHQVGDWKTYYERMKERLAEAERNREQWEEAYLALEAQFTEVFSAEQAQTRELSEENQRLRAQLALTTHSLRASPEAPLNPKKRNSLQVMLIAMAVSKYRYKPGAVRNDAVSNIVRAVEGVGLSISDDAVRTHLKQAADLLPPQD